MQIIQIQNVKSKVIESLIVDRASITSSISNGIFNGWSINLEIEQKTNILFDGFFINNSSELNSLNDAVFDFDPAICEIDLLDNNCLYKNSYAGLQKLYIKLTEFNESERYFQCKMNGVFWNDEDYTFDFNGQIKFYGCLVDGKNEKERIKNYLKIYKNVNKKNLKFRKEIADFGLDKINLYFII